MGMKTLEYFHINWFYISFTGIILSHPFWGKGSNLMLSNLPRNFRGIGPKRPAVFGARCHDQMTPR